jgi:hypothetical protein
MKKPQLKVSEPVPQRIGNLPAVGDFQLMPCAKDVCQKCAVNHDERLPHNQQSMYWQYWFYSQYARWPTWEDAMKHCTEEVKEATKEVLRKNGIKI